MGEITTVNVQPQQVIGIRTRGSYQLIPVLLKNVYEYAITKGVQFQGPPIFICHERCAEEVKTANTEGTADVEVAVPIEGSIEGTDEIKQYELPGGTMAKIIHKGPYEACEPTYTKLFAWIERNGKRVSGPIREVYLNDPREVAPEEILTEIYAPVE